MFDFRMILSLFFPYRCPFCNEIIPYKDIICDSCSQKIKYNHFKNVVATRGDKTFTCISPFLYEGQIRHAIHEFKFHDMKSYAMPFARYITKRLQEDYNVKKIDYITSIPLHITRQNDRGFNQSELFAREIGRLTGIKYVEALRKLKKNRIQHELPLSERAENVRGVYQISDNINIMNKIVILCDDILTTGNTMAECAHVLFNAGAKDVIGATIANVANKKGSLFKSSNKCK